MTLYIRIEKVATHPLNEDMSYDEAIAYGHMLDDEAVAEFDLYVDVVDENGEVVNEAGWNEE